MEHPKKSDSPLPLIENEDAVTLVERLNRAIESIEPEKFPTEQGVALYLLLDRLMEGLWNAHYMALQQLFYCRLKRLGLLGGASDEKPSS